MSSLGGTTTWRETYAYQSYPTKIVIDSSVKNVQLTSGKDFFKGFLYITDIEGLSNLKTSEMTTMEDMFYGCQRLTSLDLTFFNTYKVKSMAGMFRECWALTSIEFGPNFNTMDVTDLNSMFYSCKALTTIKNRGRLSTSSATSLAYMFYGCEKWDMSALAEDFNTELVTDMEHMFYNCKALKSLNLKKWDMSKVTKTYCMFQNCSNLTTIYRNDDWSKKAITSGSSMFSGCTSLKGGQGTTYSSASSTGLAMAHPDNAGVPGFFTGDMDSWDKLYGTVIGTTFNIRYDKECTIRGGLTNITDLSYDDAEQITTVKIESAVKNANITSTYMWFSAMPNLTSVEGLENINWSKVTNVSYMFADDVKLPSIDLRKMNLTGKKCDYMFQNCSALKTIYCDDDYTSTLSSSTQMFYGCSSLQGQRDTKYSSSHTDASYARPDGGTIAPGYFTGKLKELYATCDDNTTVMLIHYDENCEIAKGDIYWYTSNASKYRDNVTQVIFDMSMDNCHPTSMKRWFSDYKKLKEISGMMYLHTDQVTDMTETFANCEALEKLDVSRFQTTKVKTMDATFMGCKTLRELDVNSFFNFDDDAVNAIESTTRMFSFCDKLQTIYCNNDWTTLGVTSSNNMFLDSKALHCGYDTKYDADHIDISYARPGRGVTQRGYFTQKKTDIDQTNAQRSTLNTKRLLNGQLLIERDGKVYNVLGARVR